MSDSSTSSRRKQAKSQLIKMLDDDAIGVALTEVLAGDRRPTAAEKERILTLQERRGESLYSDLVFVLTHQYQPAGKAKSLWNRIIAHKKQIEVTLGRNIGVALAAGDYLTNIEHLLVHPVIIPEPSMNTIAEVALKDGLTRLYDQSTFLVKLSDELKRFKRYGNALAVLMLDLDYFKAINDTHGHQVGDKVLRELGELITAAIRDIDISARYGGEEFVLLLPRTSKDEASQLAERLRERVEAHFSKKLKVTISIGIAICPQAGTSAEGLIRAADKALYASKERGRNRVTASSDMES